jgi:hypothetical protein
MLTRLLALTLAAVALLGLALQYPTESLPLLLRLWSMARYFTNVAAALAAVTLIRAAWGYKDPNLAAMTLLATTMTGLVYAALIAVPVAPALRYPDLLLHRVLPALAPLWWLLAAPRPPQFRPVFWLLPGLIYLPYAAMRGLLTGQWPYEILNPALLGPTPAALNLAGIAVLGLALAAALKPLSGLVREPLFLQK